jgi:hypothetical protein
MPGIQLDSDGILIGVGCPRQASPAVAASSANEIASVLPQILNSNESVAVWDRLIVRRLDVLHLPAVISASVAPFLLE